jgi:hypothetical protein
MNNVVRLECSKAERWAKRITDAYRQGAEAIVRTGQELLAAKADCDHGDWGAITGETTGTPMVPFGWRTAQYFMAIANHSWLANPQHAADLPISWYTIASLTALLPVECDQFLAGGLIHADMTRADAEALVARAKAEPSSHRPPSAPSPALFDQDKPLPQAPMPSPGLTQSASSGGYMAGGIPGRPELGLVCWYGADELKKDLAAEGATPADVGWDGTEKGKNWEPPPIDPPSGFGSTASIGLGGPAEQIAERIVFLCGTDKASAIFRHGARVLSESMP